MYKNIGTGIFIAIVFFGLILILRNQVEIRNANKHIIERVEEISVIYSDSDASIKKESPTEEDILSKEEWLDLQKTKYSEPDSMDIYVKPYKDFWIFLPRLNTRLFVNNDAPVNKIRLYDDLTSIWSDDKEFYVRIKAFYSNNETGMFYLNIRPIPTDPAVYAMTMFLDEKVR